MSSASWSPSGKREGVVLVHGFYSIWGGEDSQVVAEEKLLTEAGLLRGCVYERSSGLRSLLSALVHGWIGLFWNTAARRRARQVIESSRANIVHIHNTFPFLSPAVIGAASDSSAVVVVTLHNYRAFCANGFCVRAGRACTRCATSVVPWAAVYRCYRNSAVASLAVWAYGLCFRRALRVAGAVCTAPSEAARLLLEGVRGLPDRIAVLPNIVEGAGGSMVPDEVHSGRILYVGRLSEEKGIEDLLAALGDIPLPQRPALTIAGEGPMREALERACRDRQIAVRFLGQVEPSMRDGLFRSHAVCVVPSRFPETFGLVAAEAGLAGCPLVISDAGALAETVGGANGSVVYAAGDARALHDALVRVLRDPEGRERRACFARQWVTGRYQSSCWLEKFRALTQQARSWSE